MHHRESSPEAFAAAIETGADAIETDVRRTRDGVFVCHHDATLARTAGVDSRVAGLTFAEFRALAPDYAVRLTEVVETLRGRCNLLLDLKLDGAADIASLVELLRTAGTDEAVAIGVRSLATAKLIRQIDPGLTQLGLLEDIAEAPDFVANGGRWVRYRQPDVTQARIDMIHSLGARVLVMVGGTGTAHAFGEIDAGDVALLRGQGVDGFMLNDPSLLTARS
jgi:glycerophosphoryl diester phosphodiesterase